MLVLWRVGALTTHDSTNMAYAIPHCHLNLSDLARQTPGDSPQVLLLVISTRRADEFFNRKKKTSLKKKWWLEDEFPFGMAHFQGLCFREGKCLTSVWLPAKKWLERMRGVACAYFKATIFVHESEARRLWVSSPLGMAVDPNLYS